MPFKKRKVATHANAPMVHSIPANSGASGCSARRRTATRRPASGRGTVRSRAASSTPAAPPPPPVGIARVTRRRPHRRVALPPGGGWSARGNSPLPPRRAALRSCLALRRLRWRTLGGSIATSAACATSPTASTSAAAPLLIGRGWSAGLGAGGFARPLGARRHRHDAGQPARASPPAGLLAGARVHLLDPLVELGQPLFHRPLDLRTRGARLLWPNAGPLRADGFWRGVGVGRLGLDRDLRREFRHLQKS